jgi:hypothetical protein
MLVNATTTLTLIASGTSPESIEIEI